MPLLNDPPTGAFEGRPYEELATWLREHGPDVLFPGTACTERQALAGLLDGVKELLARPERMVLVIAHGLGVGSSVPRGETTNR